MNNLNTRIILINQYFRLFFKFYTPPNFKPLHPPIFPPVPNNV